MTNPVVIGDATLYLGDCREILPGLPMDVAVITDPPYGVGFEYEGAPDDQESWRQLMLAVVPEMQKRPVTVMPCGKRLELGWWWANFPPKWSLCWYKGASPTLSPIGFSDWEEHLVWGKPPKQIHDYFSTIVVASALPKDTGHPCPKPVRWAEWLISRFTEPMGTALDPFMGSGTTGVACANLGRKFIGIEIEPKYFDIACERIDAAQRQIRMFA